MFLGVVVKLQSLLNLTCQRLFDTMMFPEDESYPEQFETFEFLFKWGCDGTSGVNEYMQLFHPKASSEETKEDISEYAGDSIFMFSTVPLQLTAIVKESGEKITQWENPHPSSTRYCRPIKFLFIKETQSTSRREINAVQEEIEALEPFKYVINGNKTLFN